MEIPSFAAEIYNSLLAEQFWLPQGKSWKDLDDARQAGLNIPHISDLLYVVFLTAGISVLRYFFENVIFKPLGVYFLENRPTEVEQTAPHSRLPKLVAALNGARISKDHYIEWATLTGVSVHKVTAWCKELHEAKELASNPFKWTETGWRFVLYTSLCSASWLICWSKDWLWNTRLCWRGYPFISIEPELKALYLVELALYLNLLISQFFDVRRSDFWAMFVHHLATISLIVFSYLPNFVRAGALVLLCHDVSDAFLEAAKLFKYAGYQLCADICFAMFAITWAFFRLWMLPFYVLHGSWFYALEEVGVYRSMVFLHGLVGVLLILHVYWFALILRVIYNKIVLNREVDDIREDDDAAEQAVKEIESHNSKQRQSSSADDSGGSTKPKTN